LQDKNLNQFSAIKEKTKWYPVTIITILFPAWHILLTYCNNSTKFSNYKEGEGQSSISMTSQRVREKNLKIGSKKRKQENLLVR